MVEISQKQYTDSGASFNYFVVRSKTLNLRRLRSGLQGSVDDFMHFKNAIGKKRIGVCVAEKTVEQVNAPQVMRFSFDGDVEFFSFRSMVSYWSDVYFSKHHDLPVSKRVPKQLDAVVSSAFEGWLGAGLIKCNFAELLQSEALDGVTVVGSLGHLSKIDSSHKAVCASAYSIINDEECEAPFQAIRDPIGFRAEAGAVTSPATYKRPAILVTSQGLAVATIGKSDMIASTAIERSPQFKDVPRIFYGASDFLATTPVLDPNQVDFVVVEQTILGAKIGGGLRIPYSGMVITYLPSADPRLLVNLVRADPRVCWSLRAHHNISAGVQCGPTLVRNGQCVDVDQALRDEDFMPVVGRRGVVPNSLHRSTGGTRAARSGVGVSRGGDLVAIVVEGTSTGSSWEAPEVAYGATFDEIAFLLKQEGAYDALALDSGGSVGLYNNGAAQIVNGDFRKSDRRFERPLAHATLFE